MSDEIKSGREDVLAEFLVPGRRERLEQVLAARSDALTLVLDEVHHPHNISAVIRSADAFGIRDVHLIGEEFFYNRTISLGSEQWVRLRPHRCAADAIAALRSDGYELVVTAPQPQLGGLSDVVPVWDLPFERRLALVFGNERRGICEELYAAASLKTFIPMYGFVESLNISVACAIALYSSTFQRATPGRRLPPLSPEARDDLRRDWLRRSTRNADAILREVERREERIGEDR